MSSVDDNVDDVHGNDEETPSNNDDASGDVHNDVPQQQPTIDDVQQQNEDVSTTTTANISGNVEVEELPQRTSFRTLVQLNITGAVPRIIGLVLNHPILNQNVAVGQNEVVNTNTNQVNEQQPTAVGVTATANFEAHFNGHNHGHSHHHGHTHVHHHVHNETNNGQGQQVPTGQQQQPPTNNRQVYNVRNRLFRIIFMKVAIIYALAVPMRVRRLIETLILASAIASLFMLTYLHVSFIRTPINCLVNVTNDDSWSAKDGILRIEIITDKSLLINNERNGDFVNKRSNHHPINLINYHDNYIEEEEEELLLQEEEASSSDLNFWQKANSWLSSNSSSVSASDANEQTIIINTDNGVDAQPLKQVSHMEMLVKAVWPPENYILEYSLEYGFLKLSPKMREKLKIPIKTISLNPTTDKCFGDSLNRFLLNSFLGYDDILMGSLKILAEKENHKGYVRNVITGEHYRFVNIWMTRTSYLSAAFIMIVFTLSISMLLRYSHHQVFVFVELMQMLEFNGNLSFPFAPLLTVILALVGMEAIMSEFFNDTTTAFYVILIVWAADQYDSMCSHTVVTRKHWLKFFYLYHFSFYAYDYRFNGQYSGLALLCSWLFIQHSMIFFFHHYELPYILNNTTRITLEGTIRFVNSTTSNNINPVNNTNNSSNNTEDAASVTPNDTNSNEDESEVRRRNVNNDEHVSVT